MLASRIALKDVVSALGVPFAIETKYDGERIQVHKVRKMEKMEKMAVFIVVFNTSVLYYLFRKMMCFSCLRAMRPTTRKSIKR